MIPNTPTTSKGWRNSREAHAERVAKRLAGRKSMGVSASEKASGVVTCLFVQRLGVDVFSDPTPSEIIRQIATRYGATIQQLRGSRGSKAVIAARQEIMWRLHVERGISSTVIGRMLGGRDHSTVLYGAKVHAARVEAAAA